MVERWRKRHAELSHGGWADRPSGLNFLQGAPIWTFAPKVSAAILDLGAWTGLAIAASPSGAQGRDYDIARAARAEAPCPAALSYGVGFPEDLVRRWSAGWDLFDCVAPTRQRPERLGLTADGPRKHPQRRAP